MQQFRAQLARVEFKEMPAPSPLSIPEVEKALGCDRMAPWMRVTLSNPQAYVQVRKSEQGELQSH